VESERQTGLAREQVSEAIALEPEIERTLQNVAAERGWEFHKDVTVSIGEAQTRVDYTLDTDYGPLLIEFAAIKRSPNALVQRTAMLKAAMHRLNAWRGKLVVPDGAVHGAPEPDVTIVEVSRLRDAMNDVG
jgi:hypothetical protein